MYIVLQNNLLIAYDEMQMHKIFCKNHVYNKYIEIILHIFW